MTKDFENLIFDASGGSKRVSYSFSECEGNVSVTVLSPDWIESSIDADNKTITFTAQESTTEEKRGEITIGVNGNSCEPIEVIQEGKAYGCGDIKVLNKEPDEGDERGDEFETRFPIDESIGWFPACIIVGPSDITTTEKNDKDKWKEIINSPSGDDMLVSFGDDENVGQPDKWMIIDGRLARLLYCKPTGVDSPTISYIYIKVGNNTCQLLYKSRICPCATDDCNSEFDGENVVVYPIFMHSRNEYGLPLRATNSDSIMIEHGEGISYLYDSETYEVENQMISDFTSNNQGEGIDGYPNTAWTGTDDNNSWVHVYICQDDNKLNGMIHYIADNNENDYVRQTTFTYYVNGEHNIISCLASERNHKAWIGHKTCQKVVVTIKQAKKDYYWAHTYEYDENGVEIREQKPIPKP